MSLNCLNWYKFIIFPEGGGDGKDGGDGEGGWDREGGGKGESGEKGREEGGEEDQGKREEYIHLVYLFILKKKYSAFIVILSCYSKVVLFYGNHVKTLCVLNMQSFSYYKMIVLKLYFLAYDCLIIQNYLLFL